MSDFYDANSPLANNIIDDKSPVDIDSEIILCDLCSNIILQEYKDNKLICPKCGNIYNPHYEIVKVQTQETTMDELSSNGELGYKDDWDKTMRKTINHREARLENLEYVKKEFERYKEIGVTQTKISRKTITTTKSFDTNK